MSMTARRRAPALLVALVASLVLVATLVATARPWDDGYQTPDAGLALGPARQVAPSAVDVVARGARGALDAAAGAAAVVPNLPADSVQTLDEQALADLLNDARTSHGLASLAFDPGLLGVARARAAAQLSDAPLSHYNAAGGLTFVGLLADANVSYNLAGENLARLASAGDDAVPRLHQALMNSPTHRANILHTGFTLLAIGEAIDSTGRVAFAQIFRAA